MADNANEAVIRVRLDTSQAKSDLDGLNESGRNAARNIGGRSRSGKGGSFGAGLGLGGAAGFALGHLKSPTTSGLSDIAGEVFGFGGNWLSNLVLGDLAPQAKANKQARDEVIQAYAYQAKALGETPAGALTRFKHLASLYGQRESGSAIMERDIRLNPTAEKVLTLNGLTDQMFEKLCKLAATTISDLSTQIVFKLAGLFSFGGRG